MKDPKRVLKKILGETADLEALAATGEPLDLLVDTLRAVQRIRKTRQWLLEHTEIDVALAPGTFHQLLDLPEINFSEESDRNLEVHQHSIKDSRQADDPVSIAHLNTVLRELFRDLSQLNDLKTKEYPSLLLAKNMSGDLVDRVVSHLQALRPLDWRGVGFLFTGWQARGIEQQFRNLFPDAHRVHPLRHHMNTVQLEMAFYQRCLEINIKWAVTGMDLFKVTRNDDLHATEQNVSELGSGLWNIVYNGMKIKTCLGQVGIRFQDSATLFDASSVTLNASS